MFRQTFLVLVLLTTMVVAEEDKPKPFDVGMALVRQTMFAESVEDRDRMIGEIKGLDLSEQELEQIMQLVDASEQNFKFNLEHGVKVRKAMRLTRLANDAKSWDERRRCIQAIIDLDLLLQYQQMFAMQLQLGESLFIKRVGPLNPETVGVKEVTTSRPSIQEEQIKSNLVDISVDRFVMIVHGWNSGPGTPGNPGWPLQMGLAYAHVLDPSVKMSDFKREAIGYSLKFSDVEIVVVDWSTIANLWAHLWNTAFNQAKKNGADWGRVLKIRWAKLPNNGPSKVHLIAHSDGCIFIESVCREISGHERQIQETFLDAYLPDDATDEEKKMGERADFAEHYFHQTLISVANVHLSEAYNMNIVMLKRIGDTVTGHDFPYKWYLRVLDEQNRVRIPGPMYNVVLGSIPTHSDEKFSRGEIDILE